MTAVTIPDFQMYDQAFAFWEEKKRGNQTFFHPDLIINTLNHMASYTPKDHYQYHCYNIYRLLSVAMLRENGNMKQLSANFKKVQLGTAIQSQNLSPFHYELLSIYIEYHQ